MPRRAGRRTSALFGGLLALLAMRVAAHPMPNTEIAISVDGGSAVFELAIPEPELRLALPKSLERTADLTIEPQRSALARYFDAHLSVSTPSGAPVPHVIRSITLWQAQSPDVGSYEELRVSVVVPEAPGFDPREFTLRYDAVIHQVPNHFALVYLDRDFHAGRIAGDAPVEVGVIRYDFRHDRTPSFEATLDSGSLWRGLLAAVALGFHHVSSGFDHLLFLASLLVVAPLRAIGRHWSLFQGWRYAARRFLGISVAFTAGHSVSLVFGAHELIRLPAAGVEVAIALSVLLAAVHAIRPLFAGGEWKIAAGFGLVHGLAFSATLVGVALDPATRALVLLGFNLGVEGAQLVVMACAIPLLYASRWRSFHVLRTAAMALIVAVALIWAVQRAVG